MVDAQLVKYFNKKKYKYFSSFEAGNCVSNSSFKRMKNRVETIQQVRMKNQGHSVTCRWGHMLQHRCQMGCVHHTSARAGPLDSSHKLTEFFLSAIKGDNYENISLWCG